MKATDLTKNVTTESLLTQFESRFGQPMRILLAADQEIVEFESVSLLLPLGFKPHHLGK